MNLVNPVNTGIPTTRAALDAMRQGNGPRKARENVLAGTQKLPDLAKSVMHFYGAKRFDGWEEWLEPVAQAFDIITTAPEEIKGGAA